MTVQADGPESAARVALSLVLLAALALAGCAAPLREPEPQAMPGLPGSAGPVLSAPGLWDGRPSLGGVWISHPALASPERVRIANPATGRTVVGTLFPRDDAGAAPPIQVSAEAVAALGLPAGVATPLEVVALGPSDTASGSSAGEAAAATAQAILRGAAIAPPQVPATIPARSAPRRPFVQLGVFAVEANARAAADRLGAQGLPTEVIPARAGAAWRVLLGPATTRDDQVGLLEEAVAQGFADAYLVAR